jgi:dienelactone hydrolase
MTPAKSVMATERGISVYRTAKTPAPTVLLVPGCGGTKLNGAATFFERTTTWLNDNGFNAVIVDYAKIVGLDSACLKQIDRAALRKIMFDALNYAAAQPFVDRRHISVLGWSLGASVALTMAQEIKPGDEPNIAAVAAYYPGCYQGLQLSAHPTLLLLGLADNVVNPYDCLKLVSQSPQPSIRVRTYPGASHCFDIAEFETPQTFRLLWMQFTSAYDAGAAADSQKALLEFLRENSAM